MQNEVKEAILGDSGSASQILQAKQKELSKLKFKIDQKIGVGGFGAVYKGHSVKDKSVVALKIVDLEGGLHSSLIDIRFFILLSSTFSFVLCCLISCYIFVLI